MATITYTPWIGVAETARELARLDVSLGLPERDPDGLLSDVLHRLHRTPLLNSMTCAEVDELVDFVFGQYRAARQ